MARSVWKGPFVDGYLLKKAESRARVGPARDDQDLEPPLDHPAAIRRADLRRLQRPEAHPGAWSPRRWSATSSASSRRPARSTAIRPTARRSGRPGGRGAAAAAAPAGTHEADAMGKKKRERALADNEAKAVARMLRVSPQKLNLVAQLIRGKKVATALADLEFSRKRIARDVQQVPGIGDRQCREQSRPRRRRSRRRRGACRQGAGDQALHAARPRPRRTHFQAVLAT